jgi:hypothetical protein
MLTRSAVLLLALFAFGCSDFTGSPSTDTPSTPNTPAADPGMAPVAGGGLSKLVTCSGLPNVGSIVKVNSYPATHTETGNGFVVTGDIVRDNAGVPGVQLYCNDTSLSMRWNTTSQGYPYCLVQIEAWPDGNKYAYWIQHTCNNGPSRRAIAIPYNAAGNTIVSTLRDTTVVFN